MNMKIQVIDIGLINEGYRLRPVNPAKVQELANSIAHEGQIVPIEVMPAEDYGRFDLISGAHRLAACIMAKLPTVLAVVADGITAPMILKP